MKQQFMTVEFSAENWQYCQHRYFNFRNICFYTSTICCHKFEELLSKEERKLKKKPHHYFWGNLNKIMEGNSLYLNAFSKSNENNLYFGYATNSNYAKTSYYKTIL